MEFGCLQVRFVPVLFLTAAQQLFQQKCVLYQPHFSVAGCTGHGELPVAPRCAKAHLYNVTR